ncbi:MAG: cupin domain-containing protein [Bacteroidales bacterium]|jgi:quercetin dioxygenase-like cupin family protein|nr:cupin domain-containing protein [Bacteroidales bacterium]MDD4215350.1 cupin domain-containing protein [Bacteroidales bacterium]
MENNELERGKSFTFPEIVEYANGAVVSRAIIKKQTGNVTVFAFDKGEGLSEHTAPFDALVIIADGNADIIINGKSNVLNAGQFIIMPANIPHAVKALEKFKMVLVMIKS